MHTSLYKYFSNKIYWHTAIRRIQSYPKRHIVCLLIATLSVNDSVADEIEQGQEINLQSESLAIFRDKIAIAQFISEDEPAPQIDGQLDDQIWQQALAYDDFHQVQPNTYAKPSEPTRFWIAYDKDSLYIAVELLDSEPDKIVALEKIQGNKYDNDDQVHITIDPFNKDRDGYFFQSNANGVRNEASITNTFSGFNNNWKGIWDVRASINEKGWSAEFAIPFKSLDFDPKQEIWGINIGRVIRRKGEVIAWTSRGSNGWELAPIAMGSMQSLQNAQQGLGLDLKLSVRTTAREESTSEQSESHSHDTAFEPSLDLLYRPSPQSKLGITINTDFSAIEVDDRIVNLTRFNAFLPEKRDFFLQDANKYFFAEIEGNGMPFFSRKIGIDNEGQLQKIEAGLKYSNQIGGLNFAGLSIKQQRSDSGESDTLNVLRASQNLSDESRIGFIFTEGKANSDDDNIVFGVDFSSLKKNFIANRQLETALWYQTVNSTNSEDNEAFGASIRSPHTNHRFEWRFKSIGENFDPGLGFVNRSGVQHHELVNKFKVFIPSNYWKSYAPQFTYNNYSDMQGRRESESLEITPLMFDSNDNAALRLSYTSNYESLNMDFNLPGNILVSAGDYNFSHSYLELTSSPIKALSAQYGIGQGSFYSGERQDQNLSFNWRPSSLLRLGIELNQSKLDFEDRRFTTRLTRLRSELAISRAWSWMLLAQYDNITRELGVNSRLRWLPGKGNEFYFVINKSLTREFDDRFSDNFEEVTAKFTYTLLY